MAACISARSCEALQNEYGEWPFATYQPSVCGESDAGLGDGCAGGEVSEIDGWEAALATCYEVGARLCTVSELYTGAAYSTGCDHDAGLVWSSTECDAGHMANILMHDVTWSQMDSQNSCQTDDTNAAVRCCADARNARMGLEMCDLYASEEGVCTSSMTCVQLGEAFRGAWRNPGARGSAAVCAESDDGLGGCMGGRNDPISWQDAEATCLGAGARLCTVEEIEADETRGSGCSADQAMIWTVDDVACGAGQHVVVVGSSNYAGQEDKETECRDDAGLDGEALRCCADTVVGTSCTAAAPHGAPPPPRPPPPPVDAVCEVAWDGASILGCCASVLPPSSSCPPACYLSSVCCLGG
jgi:hypothetical protein